MHQLLERAHSRLRDNAAAGPLNVEHVKALILESISQWESDDEPRTLDDMDVGFGGRPSKVQLGIRRIEHGRLRRLAIRYVGQLETYLAGSGRESVPVAFELGFGRKGEDGETRPPLEIGRPPYTVFLQGSVDRVDRVGVDGRRFRVIDYKTGTAPSQLKVKSGQALQLPLYTMAVDALGLVPMVGGDNQVEFGYWELSRRGYIPIKIEEWQQYIDNIHNFTANLISLMQKSAFNVSSRQEDCTDSCEHSSMCRVGQIRHLGKTWTQAPLMAGGAGSKPDEVNGEGGE